MAGVGGGVSLSQQMAPRPQCCHNTATILGGLWLHKNTPKYLKSVVFLLRTRFNSYARGPLVPVSVKGKVEMENLFLSWLVQTPKFRPFIDRKEGPLGQMGSLGLPKYTLQGCLVPGSELQHSGTWWNFEISSPLQ